MYPHSHILVSHSHIADSYVYSFTLWGFSFTPWGLLGTATQKDLRNDDVTKDLVPNINRIPYQNRILKAHDPNDGPRF